MRCSRLLRLSRAPTLISRKVFSKSFCKSQHTYESINLSFTITCEKNKLTGVYLNWLLQNDFKNALCETRSCSHTGEYAGFELPHFQGVAWPNFAPQKAISQLREASWPLMKRSNSTVWLGPPRDKPRWQGSFQGFEPGIFWSCMSFVCRVCSASTWTKLIVGAHNFDLVKQLVLVQIIKRWLD